MEQLKKVGGVKVIKDLKAINSKPSDVNRSSLRPSWLEKLYPIANIDSTKETPLINNRAFIEEF